MDPIWDLQIHNIHINAEYAATVVVTLTPTEVAMRKSFTPELAGIFTRELKDAYRASIERGDWKLYRIM